MWLVNVILFPLRILSGILFALSYAAAVWIGGFIVAMILIYK